jgi:hypothetical protein
VTAHPITEAGALRQWWRELAAGARTKHDIDPLWRAACLEARARDAIRDGSISAANEDRAKAAEVILIAAALRGRAA